MLLKLKRKILSHVKLIRFFILAIILTFVITIGFFTLKAIVKSPVGISIGLARDFIFPSTTKVLTNNGRINFLLLGIGGAGHDAPDLTDTMIFASIQTETNKASLISIPRDIWIPDLKDKINSSYMYGKTKAGVKAGIALAKLTTAVILGQPINNAIVIDFSGFKEVVDTLGGIQVNVENGFTDNQYPIAGKENDNCNGDKTYACRYMTITFNPGLQTMDGEKALEFVRSRHAQGDEGGDIARQKRQQLIIEAIIKKILTPQVIVNIGTDKKLIDIFNKDFITDMNLSEMATLGRFIVNARPNIKTYTIPDSLLFNPPNEYLYHNDLYTHAFVFIPARPDGKWDDVQKWVESVLP